MKGSFPFCAHCQLLKCLYVKSSIDVETEEAGLHPEAVVSTEAMDIPAMLECAAQGVLGHFTEVPVLSEEN